jgi:hypothetical protein
LSITEVQYFTFGKLSDKALFDNGISEQVDEERPSEIKEKEDKKENETNMTEDRYVDEQNERK